MGQKVVYCLLCILCVLVTQLLLHNTRFRVTHSKQEHSNSADLMTHLFNQAKLSYIRCSVLTYNQTHLKQGKGNTNAIVSGKGK